MRSANVLQQCGNVGPCRPLGRDRVEVNKAVEMNCNYSLKDVPSKSIHGNSAAVTGGVWARLINWVAFMNTSATLTKMIDASSRNA